MEKVVLSNGYEFELVTGGIIARSNELTVTFKPGDYTAEQLVNIWSGNNTITVKVGDNSVQNHTNFTKCASVTVIPNYHISTEYTCPECGATVEPSATECPECGATFETPNITEVTGTVCTVKCSIPDINDRVADMEETMTDLISTILG